jgi:hypothetical protein
VGVKCWDQIAESCLIPNTGENAKISIIRWAVINALDSSPGGIPGGLFIGAARGSGNDVQTSPITTPFTQSVQS